MLNPITDIPIAVITMMPEPPVKGRLNSTWLLIRCAVTVLGILPQSCPVRQLGVHPPGIVRFCGRILGVPPVPGGLITDVASPVPWRLLWSAPVTVIRHWPQGAWKPTGGSTSTSWYIRPGIIGNHIGLGGEPGGPALLVCSKTSDHVPGCGGAVGAGAGTIISAVIITLSGSVPLYTNSLNIAPGKYALGFDVPRYWSVFRKGQKRVGVLGSSQLAGHSLGALGDAVMGLNRGTSLLPDLSIDIIPL